MCTPTPPLAELRDIRKGRGVRPVPGTRVAEAQSRTFQGDRRRDVVLCRGLSSGSGTGRCRAPPHLCATPAAGYYLSTDCNMGQAIGCCPCPPDFFLAHPNRAPSCLPCTQCREGTWAPSGVGGGCRVKQPPWDLPGGVPPKAVMPGARAPSQGTRACRAREAKPRWRVCGDEAAH